MLLLLAYITTSFFVYAFVAIPAAVVSEAGQIFLAAF
jgi:hypothetical protein